MLELVFPDKYSPFSLLNFDILFKEVSVEKLMSKSCWLKIKKLVPYICILLHKKIQNFQR